MNEQQNVETIQQIYAAFGRGDITFILGQLAPGVKWMTHLETVVPWAGDYSGHVEDFFKAISDTVDVLGFEPAEFIAQGDTVVSLGMFACRAKSTGKSANTSWAFVWRLANGKVVSYEQFHDPALQGIFG